MPPLGVQCNHNDLSVQLLCAGCMKHCTFFSLLSPPASLPPVPQVSSLTRTTCQCSWGPSSSWKEGSRWHLMQRCARLGGERRLGTQPTCIVYLPPRFLKHCRRDTCLHTETHIALRLPTAPYTPLTSLTQFTALTRPQPYITHNPRHAQVASKYLKDTTAVHGTVNIEVGVGKGAGTGAALSDRLIVTPCDVPKLVASSDHWVPAATLSSTTLVQFLVRVLNAPPPHTHTQAWRGAATCRTTMSRSTQSTRESAGGCLQFQLACGQGGGGV